MGGRTKPQNGNFELFLRPNVGGANGQKTRLFEFSILVPVPHRPPLPLRLWELLGAERPPYGYPPP